MKTILENLKSKARWVLGYILKYVYGNPSNKLKIVGVTGTNGKTTTATLLYEIALALGHKVGLISTVEILISGKVLDMERKNPTTPSTGDLNKIFSKMVEEKCEYVFMEVTSHALDQNRVAGINFVGGIFTNLTHDHLNYHKNLENYFQAKRKFFTMLSPDAFALSNNDDPYGPKMLENIKAKKSTYGFNGWEDFHGEIISMGFSGLELKINDKAVHTPLIGKFNAYNTLAAYSTCLLLGFDKEKTIFALTKVTPPAGRFEYFTSKNGVLAVVDFAHSPDSLEKIILTAKDIVRDKGRVISVFGCGGDKDPFKRPVMGKLSASLSDLSIFTADNPRSEEPENIIEAMCTQLSEDEFKKVKKIIDRSEAIKEVASIARSGDIILLMGKGPETEQEIKGVKHPWNDMEKLKTALS